MGYPEADIDETGRIIRLQMDHAVDRHSEFAVQVPVPVHSTDAEAYKGNIEEVLDKDHPLAVQALPVEDHDFLDRLSPEDRELTVSRRAAANEAQVGTGHAEDYSAPVVEVPVAEPEAVVEPEPPAAA